MRVSMICVERFINDEHTFSQISKGFIYIFGVILIFSAMSKDVKSLRKSAKYGFFAILILIFLVIFKALISSYTLTREDEASFTYNFIQLPEVETFNTSLAIIILSFSFHTYTFQIYDCLEEKETKKMMICCSVGVLISTLCFMFVGSTLYFLYGENLKIEAEEIYSMFDKNTSGVLINIAFAISVLMSFPLSFFSVKNYIFYLTPYLVEGVKKIFCCSKNESDNHENNHDNANNSHDNLGFNKQKSINDDEEDKRTNQLPKFHKESNNTIDEEVDENKDIEDSFKTNDTLIDFKNRNENWHFVKIDRIEEVKEEDECRKSSKDQNSNSANSDSDDGDDNVNKDKFEKLNEKNDVNQKLSGLETQKEHVEINNNHNIHVNHDNHNHNHHSHHHPELSTLAKDIITIVVFVGILLCCTMFQNLKYVSYFFILFI